MSLYVNQLIASFCFLGLVIATSYVVNSLKLEGINMYTYYPFGYEYGICDENVLCDEDGLWDEDELCDENANENSIINNVKINSE